MFTLPEPREGSIHYGLTHKLHARRWLVDELRLLKPPQHFMTQREMVDQRRAIELLLKQGPDNPLHVYVHIPFCEEHCTFCMYFDLGAKQGGDQVQQYVLYLHPLLQHLEQSLGERQIHALYVGGGTASILTDGQIRELFSGIGSHFHPDIEATFEMSPRSSNANKLKVIRELGFNRVSFGLQTFSERLLRSMRRKPVTVLDMGELLECARRLGFCDINVDLMVGVENECEDDLYRSAEALFALRPSSVSIYRESRPRPERADLLKGLGAFLQSVVRPRVMRVAELAASCEYRVPDDLSCEHLRFVDRRLGWRTVPPECRYRTRYSPYVETTLIGVGPGAVSFCGGKLYGVNPAIQDRELARREVSLIYRATTEELGAAIVANLLYMGSKGVEHEVFRKTVGLAIEDLFEQELEFLQKQGLVQSSVKALHRSCDDAYTWAYNEKILYPEEWISYTRKHGF